MIQLFSVELLELLDGCFNQLLTALGRDGDVKEGGAVAAAFKGAFSAQIAAAVHIGLAGQLNHEGLLKGASGLHAVLEVHEQFKAVEGKGNVADEQHMQLHGDGGFGLLLLVAIDDVDEAIAVGDDAGVGIQILKRIAGHSRLMKWSAPAS